MTRPKHTRFARTLRLESLENRSLLAGGGMDFIGLNDTDQNRPDHNHFNRDAVQRDAVQRDAVQRDAVQLDAVRREHHRSVRVGDARLDRGDHSQNSDRARKPRAKSDQRAFQEQLATPVVAITPPAAPPLDLTAAIPPPFTPPRTGEESTASIRTTPTSNDALTTLATPPADPTSARQSALSVSSTTGLLVTEAAEHSSTSDAPPSFIATPENSLSANQAFSSPDPLGPIETSASDPIVIDTRQADDFIELTPFLKSADVDRKNVPHEETFQIDLAILSRLRDAIRPTPKDLVEATDAVLHDWLSGPGGMIALDHVGFGEVDFKSENMGFEKIVINVQLESTLALHRSLELFATSSSHLTRLSLSDAMLDNIMATLGEVAQSEKQPIESPTSNRLTSLAYPIVGLTIAGAALTARHHFRKNTRSVVLPECDEVQGPNR